jgi:diaminopimelate decarboxylase/aspartate kinase
MSEGSNHRWVVMKFGGTSVRSAGCWRTIRDQASARIAQGRHVVIVVSALAGVTNRLSEIAEGVVAERRDEILREIDDIHRELWEPLGLQPGRRYNECRSRLARLVSEAGQASMAPGPHAGLLAMGEWLSSAAGHDILCHWGLSAQWQDARNLLQAEDVPSFDPLAARCGDAAAPEIAAQLAEQSALHITQGFIARGPDGATCLLGRGGSDTSAACLAARLKAEALEIWTDVPGIFSADPRLVPEARVLRSLSYSEAQELASMGARVLHPPSVQPARTHNVPIFIRDSQRPEQSGTRIAARREREAAQVKAVVSRNDVTLISMENPAMWQQAGFLADAFAVFRKHGYSVDLVSTSESTVTVTLDSRAPASGDQARMADFLDELQCLCRVTVQRGCVSISLVGNAIRTILGQLSAALDVFQDRQVHMVTQSANDLNLTLVVDPEHAVSLVRKLHQLLISSQAENRPEFGPTWNDLTRSDHRSRLPDPWWVPSADRLLQLMDGLDSAYVYHLDSVRAAARRLAALSSVDRILYAVKANDHPQLLRTLAEEGMRFECVSVEELDHVMSTVPGLRAGDILFTPNFAPREEYLEALKRGVPLTVDNAWAIRNWPEVFRGRELFLRLDLDTGYGHHKKVITSGADSKFGISLFHLDEVLGKLSDLDARVTGLHAHTGSGVSNADAWREQLQKFIDILPSFPNVRVLDLGGGFSVPDRRGRAGLDLDRLDQVLQETLGALDVELWLEPGRYLVSEAGVLLSRVTQLKQKGQINYLGVNVGMNALIRPALYGAYHDIANLSRIGIEPSRHYRVVGPICESGDVLGESRHLPVSEEGDVMLLANAGAYGRVMASHYNRRRLPEELVI